MKKLQLCKKNLVTLSLALKLVVTISQGLKANFGNQARKHFCQKRPHEMVPRKNEEQQPL